MKIVVGSRNTSKVTAVTLAARAYWPQSEVWGEDVASGVSTQPLGSEETLLGALNRARAARALGGDLGVGLEGGVVEIACNYVMMSYVAVTDGLREVVVPGYGMPLPRIWGEALKEGAELRPYVIGCGLPYNYQTGVIGTLTDGMLRRDDAFRTVVMAALVPWINPAAYAEDGEISTERQRRPDKVGSSPIAHNWQQLECDLNVLRS